MKRTTIKCHKCEYVVSRSNYEKHIAVCTGIGPHNQRPRNLEKGPVLDKVLCQKLYDSGLSLRDLASKFSCGVTRVRSLGLNLRSLSKANSVRMKRKPQHHTKATRERLSEIGRKRRFWDKNLKSRSKNEKYFAKLCEGRFKIRCNEPLFNGWDADVIIPKLKVAILWNGIWHYKKVHIGHNLKHVQIRDKYKKENIIKYGYKPYVIKDMGSYDPQFVENQFNKFLTACSSI